MSAAHATRPNILLITADHMRHDALACNRDPRAPHGLGHAIHTPNLDRLAREGVTFANSFTPNPICVPGRASITTGNYSHAATGCKGNGGRIHDNQPRIADHFAQHGYDTIAVGKLHYVPYSAPGQARLLHGFQHAELCEEGRIVNQFDSRGVMRGLEDYHDFLLDRGWGGYERGHSTGNNDVHPSPTPLPAELHEEAWVAARSIAHIERHRDEQPNQPFFLWTSFTKPHPPYDPPRPYDTLYDPRDLPRPLGDWHDGSLLEGRDPELVSRRVKYGWDRMSPEGAQVSRAYYAGLVTFQDEMIGRILRHLDARGLADNTIILYSADHGDLLGDFGRFFKTCMYDGSVKVPFLIKAPGVIPAGDSHVREQLAGLQDVLPTLASLAGCPLGQRVHGMDLAPVLRDPSRAGREFYVSQTFEPPQQKYMVRTDRWKYLYSEQGGVEELYDVTRERYELTNLAGDPAHSRTRAELRGVLIDWCREHGDEKMLRDGDLVAGPIPAEQPKLQASQLGWRPY